MKHCLVVDDSKIVRQVVRKIVENLGCRVSEAEHGRDAVEQLRAHPIDVMILDGNMPVMDGVACLQHVRADTTLAQPKIIFCATENELEKIRQATARSADAYVMKPFDDAVLAATMRALGMIDIAA